MAVDFGDPTTWDEPLSEADALNLGIWALNTLQHPDASTDEQFVVADHFSERAVEILDRLRDQADTRLALPAERCTVVHDDWTGPHLRINSCPTPHDTTTRN